jgi:hypothetical protein
MGVLDDAYDVGPDGGEGAVRPAELSRDVSVLLTPEEVEELERLLEEGQS